MPLRQGDLLHAALRLPSIAHILFLLGTRQNQDVQIIKNNLLPDMVEERRLRVIGLLSSHTY